MQVGPIAGATGFSVWAFRGGDMSSLLRMNHTLTQRQVLYEQLRWEGFLWLAIIAVSYLGVIVADRFFGPKAGNEQPQPGKRSFSANNTISIITAVVLTIVLTQFLVGLLAQDVKMPDNQIGVVVGQPSVAQIAFAVIVSFGVAAWLTGKFLNVSFVYPAIAAALLTFFSITFFSAKPDLLEHMVKNWPVTFFVRSTCAILPLQMIAFAVIGSIAGYWLAARTHHEKKHLI
jgi:hypothetical protein